MVTFDEIIVAYSFWLVIFVLIGNCVALYICYRLRNSTTFVFLAFIAVSDTFTVYGWQFPFVSSILFSLNLPTLNLFACKLITFTQFSSVQISSWFLVSSLVIESS